MIIEMRTYKTKPGKRAEFLEIFRSKSVPAHAEIGMKVLGPFLSIEDPDTFFFMRGFPDLGSREPMKAKFRVFFPKNSVYTCSHVPHSHAGMCFAVLCSMIMPCFLPCCLGFYSFLHVCTMRKRNLELGQRAFFLLCSVHSKAELFLVKCLKEIGGGWGRGWCI